MVTARLVTVPMTRVASTNRETDRDSSRMASSDENANRARTGTGPGARPGPERAQNLKFKAIWKLVMRFDMSSSLFGTTPVCRLRIGPLTCSRGTK